MGKLDATTVTERVFVDGDDFVKLTFEVGMKDGKATVTTDIDMYGDDVLSPDHKSRKGLVLQQKQDII